MIAGEQHMKSELEQETATTAPAIQRFFRSGFRLLFFLTMCLSPFVFAATYLNLLMGAPKYALEMAMVSGVAFFLSVLFIAQWLLKNGAPPIGIGCIGSTFLTAAGMTVASVLPDVWYRPTVLGCGLVGWLICFIAMIPLMVDPEKRRNFLIRPGINETNAKET